MYSEEYTDPSPLGQEMLQSVNHVSIVFLEPRLDDSTFQMELLWNPSLLVNPFLT